LFGVFVVHHLAVDYVTRKYSSPEVTTVRIISNAKEGKDVTVGLRFYSLYQFIATGCLLTPSERAGDLGWNTLIAIQSSAFLMTLFKKGLIRWYTHAIVYSACLLLSLYYMMISIGSIFFLTSVLCVYFLRLYKIDKYVLWTLYTATGCLAVSMGVVSC
jgi:hypothetical protein